MMNFMQELSESRMLPSATSLRKMTARQVADLVYLHLIALRILLADEDSRKSAVDYVRRTIRHGGFDRWYQDTTDLHLMLFALLANGFEFRSTDRSKEIVAAMTINENAIYQWFRSERNGNPKENEITRLFVRLDQQFKVIDSSMHAIRRLAQAWPKIGQHDKKLCMTRLLQLLRNRAPRSEILTLLDRHARMNKLEIPGVCDPETGEGCEISVMAEDATAGATVAADIASVAMPLGPVRRRKKPGDK